MYLKFFNLKEFPFAVGADPRFFYESGIHAEALANMQYVVEQRKGMVVITGEVGAGKTFLSNILAGRLERVAQVVMVTHPPDSAKQLLRAVAEGLDIKTTRIDDKLDLVAQLEKSLERLYRRGKLVAALFDEAQDMPDEALEQIRLLWNMERDAHRLIQVVLVGQPQLRDRLRLEKWESLRQRVVLSYHLGRLSPQETARYILHRRQVASQNGCLLRFTPQALERIHQATRGIPRLVNIICDNCLLIAYAKNAFTINDAVVCEVLRDMTCWPIQTAPAQAEPTGDAL